MEKKSISFILFGVATINVITLPLTLFTLIPLYERLGMSSTAINIGFMLTAIITLAICFVLFCAGIIILIKFRKE